MQVGLLKKEGVYTDKATGEEKRFTNLYVRAGDMLVPIEVKYFGTDKNPDKQYGSRRAVLSAFADELPPLAEDAEAADDKETAGKKS